MLNPLLSNNNDNSNHFEAFFEYAAMGILVADSEGSINAINPFALKEFGYSKGELIGRKIEILIPQRFYNNHIHQRKNDDDNSQMRPMGMGMDLFAVRKDGTEFPVEVSLSHYTSNGSNFVIAFVTDISVRKAKIKRLKSELEDTIEQRTADLQKTMEQLEKSRDNLEKVLSFQKTLLDTAGAMIIATDKNGIISLFNPEPVRNLGYDESEIINKKTPVIFHEIKDIERERKRLENEFGLKVKGGFEVFVEKARQNIHEEQQCTYIRKNGTSFPVLLTITAHRDAKENINGYMGIAIDISDRIQAEEE